MIKVSAVRPEHRIVTAPARVFDDQADFLAAFDRGELDGDVVAVLRYQGPASNGMPELHKLTPALGVLQDRGHQVAIVTDGRMSGASGKVPAAIHLTPEAAVGGPLAKVRDGDLITLDASSGHLELHVPDDELAGREATGSAPTARGVVGHRPRPVRQLPRLRRVGRPRRQRLPEGPRMTMTESSSPNRRLPAGAGAGDPRRRPRRPGHRRPGGPGPGRRRVPVIELTLRTPVALEAMALIAAEVPEILLGAGTVADAHPGLAGRGRRARRSWSPRAAPPTLLDAMTATGLPHLPGVATVTEVLTLLERGYREMKFFPAEAAGGAPFLKAISSPVPAARFCPTGGISAANAGSYLALPNVGCVGGSWLTPASAVAAGDWATITPSGGRDPRPGRGLSDPRGRLLGRLSG